MNALNKQSVNMMTVPEDELSPALRYHAYPRAGKIEVISSKPLTTQADLSLGYTPGVRTQKPPTGLPARPIWWR